MGRPSTYTPEIAKKICEQLELGVLIKHVCAQPGMPHYGTFFEWVAKYPEFAELSARARIIGTHHRAEETIEIADDPNLDPADKKVRIDARNRANGWWNRKDYGEKRELSGPDGGPIEVNINADAAEAKRRLLGKIANDTSDGLDQ